VSTSGDEQPAGDEDTNDRKGTLLGMPYNLSRPKNVKDATSSIWNSENPHFFTPKRIGWGYDINFYWVAHPFGYLKGREQSS
jgi:hypothetical protein